MAKLGDRGFRLDLVDLARSLPDAYDQLLAADMVMERLESQLANAPKLADIEHGHWRQRQAG